MAEAAKFFKLRLFINNKLITLKPFLSNFVKQIILSMVCNLKDVEKPRKVELVIERSGKDEV